MCLLDVFLSTSLKKDLSWKQNSPKFQHKHRTFNWESGCSRQVFCCVSYIDDDYHVFCCVTVVTWCLLHSSTQYQVGWIDPESKARSLFSTASGCSYTLHWGITFRNMSCEPLYEDTLTASSSTRRLSSVVGCLLPKCTLEVEVNFSDFLLFIKDSCLSTNDSHRSCGSA